MESKTDRPFFSLAAIQETLLLELLTEEPLFWALFVESEARSRETAPAGIAAGLNLEAEGAENGRRGLERVG